MLRSLRLLPILLLTACSSSGSGEKPVFPVTGKLLLNGQPVANARLVFHPEGEDVRPQATTDTSGAFHLTTYRSGDGAPQGDYKVTVELWLSPGGDKAPENQLPAKYANPASSGLTATVNAGPTELAPFNITR